jgi:hypothetical protein
MAAALARPPSQWEGSPHAGRRAQHSTSLIGSGVARGDHTQAAMVASSLVNASSPALLAGGRQMLSEPLADLESRLSVGLVVELESAPRLERVEALG